MRKQTLTTQVDFVLCGKGCIPKVRKVLRNTGKNVAGEEKYTND